MIYGSLEIRLLEPEEPSEKVDMGREKEKIFLVRIK